MIPTSQDRDERPYQQMLKVAPWPAELLAPLSEARAQLWIPRPALASCVRAAICRDTLGVELSDEQRYSHFPAAPTCTISWIFSGDMAVLEPGCPAHADSPREAIAPITFNGPWTRPPITWSPGPGHGLMLLLMPDAVAQLTGIDPRAFVDRVVPVEEVFDADWLAFFRAVAEAGDDERRIALIEAFLLPRWRQARSAGSRVSHLLSDWSRGLTLRAATWNFGRSSRQVERRIKQWTGQTMRDLRALARQEQVFFQAVNADKAGSLSWSDLASDAGFADQSHLSRETRRVTGFAPEELRRRIATEESFWAYRLWGFSADAPED